MALSSETSQIDYTGNAATVDFPTTFKFLDEEDLVVELAPSGSTSFAALALGVDYTVSGEGDDDGGTVTMIAAPDTGETLRITRTVEITQPTSFRSQGSFSPRLHEQAFDRQTMISQQVWRDLTAAVAGLTSGGAAFGALTAQSPLTPSNALQALFRSNGNRVEVSEYGGRWRRVTDQDEVRDIRDYLSTAQKARLEGGLSVNATDAMQEIFAEISAVPGTATEAQEARIFHPGAADDLFEIEETCEYVGGVSRGLSWHGEHSLSRLGDKGTGYKWVGAEGGTMFDLRAINGSRIHGLQFNGGGKAKYVVRAREFYDGVNLVPSTGVFFEFCRFTNPTLLDGNSCLFAAGANNGGSTYQASEYNFLFCQWQGCNELGTQGWGFKALANGNTKNFFFLYNDFGYLYRCIEAGSGRLAAICTTASNIGYNRGDEAAVFFGYGDTLTIDTLAVENGGAGYKSRWIKSGSAGSGTVLDARGLTCVGTLPADDYGVITFGPSKLTGRFTNSRAGSNNTKLQVTAESSGGGSAKVEECIFVYNSTALTCVPIYDGSHNLLSDGDYARNTGHRLRCEGNMQGLDGSDLDDPLPDFVGDDVPNLRDQMKTDNNTAGLTIVRNANGTYAVTIPFGVFKTSGTGIVVIGELPLKSKLSECIPDTTIAFAGPAGTIQLRVGIDDGTYDDDSLVLPHDVKTGVTRKGQADADLGVDLALATSARGRGEYYGAWTGTGHSIKVKMVLGAGALTDLVAGSVTVCIEHKRVR